MRRRAPFKAALIGAALAVSAAGLSGCGFTPLYAAPGVTSGLANIQVDQPQGRLGFLMREQLQDAFASTNGGRPQYRLAMQLSESRNSRGVRLDNVADRYEYRVNANYALYEVASGRRITGGSARVTVTYANPTQPYASIAADQEGQERAAAEASRQIQVQLATWLAGQRKGGS